MARETKRFRLLKTLQAECTGTDFVARYNAHKAKETAVPKPFDIDRPLPFLQQREFGVHCARYPGDAAARTSTVLDYMHANAPGSLSGAAIDAGLTPFLLSVEARATGTWPFTEVEDVGMRANDDDTIGIWVGAGKLNLPPDTLLFWR